MSKHTNNNVDKNVAVVILYIIKYSKKIYPNHRALKHLCNFTDERTLYFYYLIKAGRQGHTVIFLFEPITKIYFKVFYKITAYKAQYEDSRFKKKKHIHKGFLDLVALTLDLPVYGGLALFQLPLGLAALCHLGSGYSAKPIS